MQKEHRRQGNRYVRGWHVFLTAAAMVGSLCVASPSSATDERSYQAIRKWLEEYRTATPSFQPGEHLTNKDIERLRPFIPQPGWEYFFYPEMDMEIAATGHYPPPPEWGTKMKPGYYLDDQ